MSIVFHKSEISVWEKKVRKVLRSEKNCFSHHKTNAIDCMIE